MKDVIQKFPQAKQKVIGRCKSASATAKYCVSLPKCFGLVNVHQVDTVRFNGSSLGYVELLVGKDGNEERYVGGDGAEHEAEMVSVLAI